MAHRMAGARSVAVVTAVACASAGGCLLTTSLDGLTDGAGSAGASDGSTTDGASGGADAADSAVHDASASTDAALPYPAEVLADGPLAYWRFGESAGTSARDETGHGNSLNIVGTVVWGAPGALSGDPNTAVRFDGNTSGAVAGAGALCNFAAGAPFTAEIWMKPEVIDATYRRLFSNATYDGAGLEGWGVWLQSPYGLGFERNVAGAQKVATFGMPTAPATSFTHVVARYDGSRLSIYVNGVVQQSTADARSLPSFPGPCAVGNRSDTGASFQGVLDEAAIYDKALSDARIQAHFNAAH